MTIAIVAFQIGTLIVIVCGCGLNSPSQVDVHTQRIADLYAQQMVLQQKLEELEEEMEQEHELMLGLNAAQRDRIDDLSFACPCVVKPPKVEELPAPAAKPPTSPVPPPTNTSKCPLGSEDQKGLDTAPQSKVGGGKREDRGTIRDKRTDEQKSKDAEQSLKDSERSAQ
jgi:hypothetical protein